MNRTLDVYLDHSLVGHLMQDQNGKIRYAYSDIWLANSSAVPLSWSLPLQSEPFDQRACRGFFAGILPEDSNREAIARILGISARNDYAMLEQIGGECAGAVTFLAAGTHLPDSDYDYQALDDAALVRVLKKLPRQPLLVGEPGLRLSLAGVQNKIAVHIDDSGQIFIPLGGAPSTFILKLAIERFPHSVSNEALCLELAKSIGIPVVAPKIGLVENISYILVTRYDRTESKEEKYPGRLHQEDFCQALGIASENKYQNEGGPSLKDCFALLREASSLPAVDIQNLLNMVIFNIIVGNHDAHGKNFSLIFNISGGINRIRLAPAYDILSTVYYPELTEKMAMKIGQEYESQKLSRKDIKKFAEDVGLGVAAVEKRIVKISKKVIEKLPPFKDSFPEVVELIILINERALRLLSIIEK